MIQGGGSTTIGNSYEARFGLTKIYPPPRTDGQTRWKRASARAYKLARARQNLNIYYQRFLKSQLVRKHLEWLLINWCHAQQFCWEWKLFIPSLRLHQRDCNVHWRKSDALRRSELGDPAYASLTNCFSIILHAELRRLLSQNGKWKTNLIFPQRDSECFFLLSYLAYIFVILLILYSYYIIIFPGNVWVRNKISSLLLLFRAETWEISMRASFIIVAQAE